MSYLIENYVGIKPKGIVPMLYALDNLNLLTLKPTQGGKNLRSALIKTFGEQLQDSALKAAIPTYDPKSNFPDLEKQQKIEQQRQKIAAFLKPK